MRRSIGKTLLRSASTHLPVMRKGSCRRRGVSSRRGAFSLVELVISIAILLLMLALAGEVMNLTVTATGQATAITQVNQIIRVLETQLRDDLQAVKPEESVIVIQGNPINAYWRQDDSEIDDDGDPFNDKLTKNFADPVFDNPPRADMLMFFTARKSTSFVNYTDNVSPVPYTVTSGHQQIVYGHADLGEYLIDPLTGLATFDPDPAAFPELPNVSPASAQNWHLARRSVVLMSQPPPASVDPPWVSWLTGTNGLHDPTLLTGESDVVGNFDFDLYMLQPGGFPGGGGPPFYWPDVFNNSNPLLRSQLALLPPAKLANRLGHYFMPNCASFKVEWTLDPASDVVGGWLDREQRILWIDQGDFGADPMNPTDDDPLRQIREAEVDATTLGQGFRAVDLQWLLSNGIAGVNDVGWTPYSLEDRFGVGGDPQWLAHSLATSGGRPSLAVFTANRGTNGSLPEEFFPKALRITVEMFDRENRLQRPISHVMVIPVGG